MKEKTEDFDKKKLHQKKKKKILIFFNYSIYAFKNWQQVQSKSSLLRKKFSFGCDMLYLSVLVSVMEKCYVTSL